MDSEVAVKMVFGIIGGLGIFLLGMKNMSEGMQAVAGERLRKMIGAVTNNRIMACGMGTAITCLVQSSSITTVMVVGMVNAGIMNLMQAIGVILGANIGTTITGWILVLKVGKYGLPILGIAAFFYLFSKRDKVRFTASIFVGLGMVFYGLQLMKQGFAPLKDMPEFVEWFAKFSPENYIGVLKCCLVGAVLTAIVQSSSATLGITISLAYIGAIDYPTAAALVLGENIGTTVTAYLASLGASSNAKRASYAHIMVNLLGVAWITLIFAAYTGWIVKFIGTDPGMGVLAGDGTMTYPFATKAIAATHTGFNVVNVLIFLPLTGLLSKLLYKMVPAKEVEMAPHLTVLNVRMLDTPALAIQQSQKEIFKMSDRTEEMLDPLREVIVEQKTEKKNSDIIFGRENDLDLMQKEIVEFIGEIMVGNISHRLVERARRQLRIADEYESISDYIMNILKLNIKMQKAGMRMSEEGLNDILALHDRVAEFIRLIDKSVKRRDVQVIKNAQNKGNAITRLMKESRTRHLDRVESGTTSALKSLIYTDILNSYRRIKDHALNIAEVLAGEK